MFRLLAISDRATLGREISEWLRDVGGTGETGETDGVDAVQLREKDLDDRALYGLVRVARSVLPPRIRLLVNGRLDIALAAGADGAHLPADGVPLSALRQRFGTRVILGRSAHSLEEVEQARQEGADYVTFGPVYETPSKAGFGPPLGLENLARAAALGIPVLALGGITLPAFGEIAAAGAAGVAGIRLFQDPAHLKPAIRSARTHFSRESRLEH